MEPTATMCSVCHQPILPAYYFCPNCGNNLHAAPLEISIFAQAKLYIFSIILPMIGFLLVTKWQGQKYYKSNDPKTKQIGEIAWILIILSTLFTIWLAVTWTQNYIQETVNGINSDLSEYGG